MTDQPYTQADLLAEAARQHSALTEDPDYMGVGEQMIDSELGATGRPWGKVLTVDEFDAARHHVYGLVAKAADTSAWAVALGADGLKPVRHPVNLRHKGWPVVRAHLAFPPHLTEDERDHITEVIAEAIAAAVGLFSEGRDEVGEMEAEAARLNEPLLGDC